WNHGGSSDEIFNRGYRYLVGVPSPASDYFRGLPQWLVTRRPSLRQIRVVHAPRGTFASQVARGAEEAAKVTRRHSIALVPMRDSVLGELCAASPEALILAGSFEEEVGLIRMRHRWAGTIQVVAAVAAGVTAFYEEVREAAEGVIGPS